MSLKRFFFVFIRFVAGSICLISAASALSKLRFDDFGILLSQLLFAPMQVFVITLGFLFGCLLFAKTWTNFLSAVVKKQMDRFLICEMIFMCGLILFLALDYFWFMACAFLFILIYGGLVYKSENPIIVHKQQTKPFEKDDENR